MHWIDNNSVVGGRALPDRGLDWSSEQRLPRTSRSTAHGVQVIYPLDYMGTSLNNITFCDFLRFLICRR